MHNRALWLLGLLGLGFSACAAPAPPPASSPDTAAVPPIQKAAAPVPAPAADAAVALAPSEPVAPPASGSAATTETKPPEATIEKPLRSPVDILTSPDTAFLIDYGESAPLETARHTCSEKAGADDEAIAKCMSAAREAFKPDVLRFKKSGDRWSWVIYKRDGSRLDEVYSCRVDLLEDSPSSVKLKVVGGDKGARPLLRSKREIVVRVPNDYSFEIDDADLGHLVYDAKIGLVAN